MKKKRAWGETRRRGYAQFQGSKKKARKKEYFERMAVKADQHLAKIRYNEVMASGNIEEMAAAMGIKLK